MSNTDAALRRNVSMLGSILGETIKQAHGESFFDKVEEIRGLSKSARAGNEADRERLLETLASLSSDELLPVTRAFSHFLNYVNTAEMYHSISRQMLSDDSQATVGALLQDLKQDGVDGTAIKQALADLKIELVLTAHPTEITRRTLIHKYVQINNCLSSLELQGLSDQEREDIESRLAVLIAQAWYTDEIRENRPTPVDEAKWGFAVVENSLWQAVPQYLRQLDQTVQREVGTALPLQATPVRFVSWMGGDRDGNPYVTAEVTREVLWLSRWKAADLYLRDVNTLIEELSMKRCADALRAQVGDAREPYRVILRKLRADLGYTLHYLSIKAANADRNPALESDGNTVILDDEQLWQPLYACYESLQDCGMGVIADGLLLDVLRRVRCFGVHLVRLDIRQGSERHTEVLSELTQYLELGDYHDWSESRRQEFLLQELASKRPLVPQQWQPSNTVQEVLDTFAVIAAQPQRALGTYVISMAREASDVLAVKLLLKEAGCPFEMDVAPLFETLDDLNHAAEVIGKLLSLPGYRKGIDDHQMVMIGYSDSAKDAGVMAASWAQYSAQEALIRVCRDHQVALTLFHGRGGTIGRGGAPAGAALMSQPPGSLKGGLRVTEQGEMIRFKLGLADVAVNSLNLYTRAILRANLQPPPEPKPEWREVMDSLSNVSCDAYRGIVREEPEFVPYFRSATPELELAKLPLGSRPSKRNPKGGVESLRAIPWIFAWMQNRLMLPAWLGAGEALEKVVNDGQLEELETMCQQWPFFSTRLSMLEMVYVKTDIGLAEHYDRRLVEPKLWPLGQRLRERLSRDIEVVLDIANENQLMAHEPGIKESIALRNVYTDPLNVLQAELLCRSRQQPEERLERALMITIGGIAAGMRNSG